MVIKNVEKVERIYKKKLKNDNEWLNVNRLSFNVGKSNLILIRKNKTKVKYKPDIKIIGDHIKQKEYVKHQEVLNDSTLSWTYQVNHVNPQDFLEQSNP